MRGKNGGNYKLTPMQVKAVRARYKNGESIYRLADRYGMSKSSIYSLVTRETYQDV